jgi:tripartite-type tricarboxylate transporter receptor subunit TctC
MATIRSWPAAALLGVLAAVAAAGEPARCDEYPSRPVKLVVPYPAGGPIDMIGRSLAQRLSKALGGQFFVENIPGAGGVIGMRAAAAAAADGYTLLVANENLILQPLVKTSVPYDPFKSFAPVSMVVTAPMVIAVHSSVPAKTMAELVGWLKANPGKLNYASPGYGSSPHLASEWLFNITYGLKVIHVPFLGAAPAVQAVLRGEPPVFHEVLPAVLPYINQGAMRGLAVASSNRSPFLPDVPTLAETGVPGHEVGFWSGLLAPSGTPTDVLQRLHAALAATVGTPDFGERLVKMGFDVAPSTPEQFTALMRAEADKWRKVVHDADIKIE